MLRGRRTPPPAALPARRSSGRLFCSVYTRIRPDTVDLSDRLTFEPAHLSSPSILPFSERGPSHSLRAPPFLRDDPRKGSPSRLPFVNDYPRNPHTSQRQNTPFGLGSGQTRTEVHAARQVPIIVRRGRPRFRRSRWPNHTASVVIRLQCRLRSAPPIFAGSGFGRGARR